MRLRYYTFTSPRARAIVGGIPKESLVEKEEEERHNAEEPERFHGQENANGNVKRAFSIRGQPRSSLSFFSPASPFFEISTVNLSTTDRLIPQWERDLKVKERAWKKKSSLLGILTGDDKWSAHQPENAGMLADSTDWIKPLSITSTRYAPRSTEHSVGDSRV